MKKTIEPLVSVVIPAYNAKSYIRAAVDSMLNQTYVNIEVIVIDDGSTDGTLEVLSDINDARLKIFKNDKNMKIVATLNKGMKIAAGKYIARMDADDYSYPDRILKQVNFMEVNESVAVLGCAIDICDSELNTLHKRLYPETHKDVLSKIFRYNPFAHPAVMIRKAAIGSSEYELNWAEDYDMWFQLGRNGKLSNLSDTLVKLRTHRDSISQSKTVYQEKLTLYIRLKAVFEYGYKMTTGDKLYFFMQCIGVYIIPSRVKFYLFSKIRSLHG